MTGSVTPLVNLHLRSRPVLLSSGQRRHSSRSLKRGQRALPFLLLLVFPSLGWWSGLILKDIQAMFDTFSHHHVCFQLQYLTHKSKVFIKLSLAVVISNFLFFLTSMPEQFWKLKNKLHLCIYAFITRNQRQMPIRQSLKEGADLAGSQE